MNYEKYFHEHLYYIHACTIKKHSCPQKIICVRIYTYCVRVYEMMFMTFFCSSLLPYALNNNRIFQIVKNLNKVSIVKVILYISNFQPKKILLPSSVPVQYQLSPIWTETCIKITLRPAHPTHPTPGKYIWATSRLHRKLKFGMEALFNPTRSTR